MAQVNPAELAYGSDKTGLVWGYSFKPGQPPRQIECDAALRWLATPARADSSEFVWLHLSLSNAAAERWMRQSLQLADAFYESLHEGVGSTRLEVEGDALVAVMHDVLFNLSFDAANISTVSLCMDPRLVVTARLRPLRSVDRLRASVKAGQSIRSSAELLAHLLHDQADVLVDIIRQSTARVDAVEDNLLANRIGVSRNELSTLRRSLVRLQRLLAPEPAALFRLLNRPPAWLSEDDLGDLRQAAEEFSTAVVDAGALTERLKLLQEELSALVSEHSNRTLFILTAVTVLALPINLVAGLLGMNVGGIPLSQHHQGFMLVVGSLTFVTGVLAYWLLLRRRE
ncbi:MAG TPA: transporter [Steroidobacteraceae bacterium]|jgi:zinc transporter|nr:transporter [Steroidobacteraceae bacterium]